MTQKTKDWATRTPLKVYLPRHRKLKIEPAQHLDFCVMIGGLLVGFVWFNLLFSVSWLVDLRLSHTNPTKRLPTMTQKTKDWATFCGVRVAQSLVFCVMVSRLLVGFVWLNRTPLKVYLPWQKTKDWATRTPLKVYQPCNRKLKIEPCWQLLVGFVWLNL
jgi:hypothetical protein